MAGQQTKKVFPACGRAARVSYRREEQVWLSFRVRQCREEAKGGFVACDLMSQVFIELGPSVCFNSEPIVGRCDLLERFFHYLILMSTADVLKSPGCHLETPIAGLDVSVADSRSFRGAPELRPEQPA